MREHVILFPQSLVSLRRFGKARGRAMNDPEKEEAEFFSGFDWRTIVVMYKSAELWLDQSPLLVRGGHKKPTFRARPFLPTTPLVLGVRGRCARKSLKESVRACISRIAYVYVDTSYRRVVKLRKRHGFNAVDNSVVLGLKENNGR